MNGYPFQIVSLNVSSEKGTRKHPVPTAVFKKGSGIISDAHAGPWHRQVSLMSSEEIDEFSRKKRPVEYGEFAENITTQGIDLNQVAILDTFTIGSVELEVTQIGKECHSGCDIFKELGACIMPKAGIFTRVLHGGDLTPGMSGEYTPRDLRIHVVTLSDRASRGDYEDLSGPRIMELVDDYYANRRDHLNLTRHLLPDDRELLLALYETCEESGADFIITTGGTGIGPRDIAPETTEAFCERLIPGIMDYVRMKYGTQKPAALLSRSTAGIKGCTAIMNIPGSVKAVEEYLAELLPMFDHIRRMIHGIDHHSN